MFLTGSCVQTLLNFGELALEIRVSINFTSHFFVSVENGGVVPAPQFLSNFNQRTVGFLLDQVNGYLSG